MIPSLFRKDLEFNSSSDHSNLDSGLPLIDCISCKVEQELNGVYELEMVYKADGYFADQIKVNMIIFAAPNSYDPPQAFRVIRVKRSLHGGLFRMTVNAQHISYDMLNIPVYPPFIASSIDDFIAYIPNEIYNDTYNIHFIISKSPLIKDEKSYVSYQKPTTLRNVIFDSGGILNNTFSKELDLPLNAGKPARLNLKAKILNNRIIIEPVRGTIGRQIRYIRYGIDLLEFDIEENTQKKYSVMVPYAVKDNNIIYLDDILLYGDDVGQSDYDHGLRTSIKDLTKTMNEEGLEINASNLLLVAKKEFAAQGVNRIYKVNILDMESMAKEHGVADIQLGDDIIIDIPPIGANLRLTCLSQTFDVLAEKYTSINVGNMVF